MKEKTDRSRGSLVSNAVSDFIDLYILTQSTSLTRGLMFELTFAQARALIVVSARKTLTVSGLASILGINKATASILIGRLVTRGLVTRRRDAGDGRRVLISLSRKGEEIGAGRKSARRRQWLRTFGRLNDPDLKALCRGLKALLYAARSESAGTGRL